jgi:hypothetical protein
MVAFTWRKAWAQGGLFVESQKESFLGEQLEMQACRGRVCCLDFFPLRIGPALGTAKLGSDVQPV